MKNDIKFLYIGLSIALIIGIIFYCQMKQRSNWEAESSVNRYEIVSLGNTNVRLDKVCGNILILGRREVPPNYPYEPLRWENMPIQELPSCSLNKEHYQIFVSTNSSYGVTSSSYGVTAPPMLLDKDTGTIWIFDTREWIKQGNGSK